MTQPFSTINPVPVTATIVAPADALSALARVIAEAKEGDPLAPVAVIVPTNQCGVMARRALGRDGGIVGVDMVTLNRLAELVAGPALAEQGRRPVSAPVLDLTIAEVLRLHPGRFAPVADHPSTIVALRELHRELRVEGPEALALLDSSWRGREPARISAAVTARLHERWYDEADLLTTATSLVRTSLPAALRRLVVHLPGRLDAASRQFLHALGEVATVHIVAGRATGGPPVDDLVDHLATDGITDLTGADREEPIPTRIVSTTDADDEVRVAVDAVIDAARGVGRDEPVPFERIAVLWPASHPYARLVEHHLRSADIPWNGPSGTMLTERITPRLLLDLLDLDRRGLRRRELFDLLADVPARDESGAPRHTSEWERVSKAAGVSREEDWAPRLRRVAARKRWTEPAQELEDFVTELRTTLGHRGAKKTWWDWARWCDEQLDAWLGRDAFRHLSDTEYRAWEALVGVLERLRHLDAVSDPVTRGEFRSVLESELQDTSSRQGRVGAGVTVGSLAGAVGLDIDVVIVLGAAEGLMPPPPAKDPLLFDADRAEVGLPTSDERTSRLHDRLTDVIASADTTITIPRGDLRATALRQPSRWVAPWAESVPIDTVGSHTAGVLATRFPTSERQRRLRDRLRATRAGRPLADVVHDDMVSSRALTMLAARAAPSLTVFDGDLSGVDVPRLESAVSPTQLQAWAKCPFAYFVQYLLGIRVEQEPDAEITITPLEKGSLQHEVLDRFHRDVLEGRLPPPGVAGWGDEHRTALAEHAAAVCDEWEAQGRSGRPATWVGERTRLVNDLSSWLQHDSELTLANRARPIASEWKFGQEDGVSLPLPGGRLLAVRGAVDRVDARAGGGLIVTDHKTGSPDKFKKLTHDDPTLGRTLFQLPVYAAAAQRLAESLGIDAGGPVRAEYGMFRVGQYKRHGVEFDDEVWGRVSEDLGSVVAGIEGGWFPQLPEAPGFRLWIDCPFCEPDGLGTTVAWERWEHKRGDPRLEPWFGEERVADG